MCAECRLQGAKGRLPRSTLLSQARPCGSVVLVYRWLPSWSLQQASSEGSRSPGSKQASRPFFGSSIQPINLCHRPVAEAELIDPSSIKTIITSVPIAVLVLVCQG